MIDITALINRLFELYGGKEEFFDANEKQVAEFEEQWNQNIEVIGKVLRSHLVIETYLTRYLQFSNPNLGDVDKARLSFSQKLSIIGKKDNALLMLLPGIKRINKIRNELAHNLNLEVTDNDKAYFLSNEIFSAMRNERNARFGPASNDPLTILEEFARFAAIMLQAKSVKESAIWEQVFSDPVYFI
jgi:hypothetical protein